MEIINSCACAVNKKGAGDFMEGFGRVYGIECLINHKIYVGKTIQPLEKRIQGHKWGKKSLISRAMRKYGFENFVYIVIEECETPEKLNEREIYWIAKLNCKNPNGYNMTDGGEGCLGFHHSEDAKKRMALSKIGNQYTLGYKHTPQTRAKCTEQNLNRSPKVYAKSSATKKKYKFYLNLESELEKNFITHRKLARLLGLHHCTLDNKLRGHIKFQPELMQAIKEILKTDMSIEELFDHKD